MMSAHGAARTGHDRLRVWDLPLRLFHWLLVVSVAVALLSAEEGSPINDWHILSGWVAGILVAFRVVWGMVGGEHSRFSDFFKPSAVGAHVHDLMRGRPEPTVGHNPLGALSVIILLAAVAATTWTGATGADDVHELLGWTLLVLVAIHVLAVVAMSFLTRENLLRAMVDGTKDQGRHPAARDSRAPGIFAYLAAAIALGAAAWGVSNYDPRAFALRGTESYEHRDRSEQARTTERSRDQDED